MTPSDSWRNRLPDVMVGLRQGALIGVTGAVVVLGGWHWAGARHQAPNVSHGVAGVRAPSASTQVTVPVPQVFRSADLNGHVASPDARFMADWVADSHNNGPLPFVILDKRDARVYVFDAQARLIDSSPVLLGATPGDDSADGIGERPMAQVRQDEKTTPAGRFISAPGKNASGEDVVWVNYDAAVSMHRVRLVDPKERRLERLASSDPRDRRISYGCINIPVAFFESVVQPTVGSTRAVVYVLPEIKDVHEVFPTAYGAQRSAAAAPLTPAS